MGIGNIGGFGGFVPGYAASRIPSVSTQEVKQQELQRRQAENSAEAVAVNSSSEALPREEAITSGQSRRDAALEDISLTFHKQESFDYIGQDSDIRSLDMQKAISDMQKDQILQQYHYFVGSSKNLMEESGDGVVIAKGF